MKKMTTYVLYWGGERTAILYHQIMYRVIPGNYLAMYYKKEYNRKIIKPPEEHEVKKAPKIKLSDIRLSEIITDEFKKNCLK